MDKKIRKGIFFDLDTDQLKEYYPKPSWNHAYDDVERFLKNHGFTHEQGSGYLSKEPMAEGDTLEVIHELRLKYPWLNKCVTVLSIADMPATHDATYMFDKEADVPRREDIKTEKKKTPEM